MNELQESDNIQAPDLAELVDLRNTNWNYLLGRCVALVAELKARYHYNRGSKVEVNPFDLLSMAKNHPQAFYDINVMKAKTLYADGNRTFASILDDIVVLMEAPKQRCSQQERVELNIGYVKQEIYNKRWRAWQWDMAEAKKKKAEAEAKKKNQTAS